MLDGVRSQPDNVMIEPMMPIKKAAWEESQHPQHKEKHNNMI